MGNNQIIDQRVDLAQVQLCRRVRVEHGGMVDMRAVFRQERLHGQFLQILVDAHQSDMGD